MECPQGLPTKPVVTGFGDFIYEYVPGLLKVPGQVGDDPNVLNGHGLDQDDAGNIYYTFQPASLNEDTRVLVRFSPDGSVGSLLGAPGPNHLSRGVPHGLRFEKNANAGTGVNYLYHANNAAIIFKTTTDGDLVWEANLSDPVVGFPQPSQRPDFWPVRPTDTYVRGDTLYVADGYGSSWVHLFNKHTGQYLNASFGGKGKAGSATEPVKFNIPHSIQGDPRYEGVPIVITDRSNERLVYVNENGNFLWEVALSSGGLPESGSNSRPCAVQFMNDDKRGLVAIIPSLGSQHVGQNFTTSGAVGIYDKDNKLISELRVSEYLWEQGDQHPHDAMFLPNGDIVICTYGGACQGRPSEACRMSQYPHVRGASAGTISYWRRVVRDNEMCSSHPACVHLVAEDGLCCPTKSGEHLECCKEGDISLCVNHPKDAACCAAHSGCAGLTPEDGTCCPTTEGVYLECCGQDEFVV